MPKKKKRNADRIASSTGGPYHIGCNVGDLSRNIILVGDPGRAFRISHQFDEIHLRKHHREYITYTGIYKRIPISVMATGIGQGNMEIAMIEISQIVSKPTIIRCGTCSSLQENIALGDMIITETVHDMGNVASYYKIQRSKIKSHPKVKKALIESCKSLGLSFYVGKTASSPGFYGPQGRKIKGFPIKNRNIISQLSKKKVLNLEMEMATMFSLASLKKIPVGGLCSAIANRVRDDMLSEPDVIQAEKNSIQCVLKAFELLHKSNTRRKK